MTSNDQRRAHFQTQRAAKKQVEDAVHWLVKRQGIKDLGPSIVTAIWFAPDKRKRDSDSLGPFVKAALDAMVKAGVWPDDNSDWVVETRMAVSKSETRYPRIELIIQEVEEYDRY